MNFLSSEHKEYVGDFQLHASVSLQFFIIFTPRRFEAEFIEIILRRQNQIQIL